MNEAARDEQAVVSREKFEEFSRTRGIGTGASLGNGKLQVI